MGGNGGKGGKIYQERETEREREREEEREREREREREGERERRGSLSNPFLGARGSPFKPI